MTDVVRLSLPLTLWLVSFSAVYGLHGVLCSVPWALQPGIGDLPLGRVVLVAAWAGAVLVQAGCVAALAGGRLASPRRFIRRLCLALAITALVAAIWTLLPVALLAVCR